MFRRVTLYGVTAIAVLVVAGSANAAIEVTPDHIVLGSATGTLVVIDVPFNDSTGSIPVFGGPNWTEDADDGFIAPEAANDGLRGPMNGISPWEPDGTSLSEAKGYFTFGNGPAPSVTWTFDAASGIDLPDGSVIHAIYATWLTRNVDGITYQYTEGVQSDSIVKQNGGAAPTGDLVLSWIDSDSNSHQGNFELLFTGPIDVEGGDGFELWGTDNIGNAAHLDAVILDVTLNLPPDQAGDFNGDGAVEAADLALLLGNWGGTIQPGDWTTNWDDFVDANELADLLGNWGAGLDATPTRDMAAIQAVVPEPAAITLLAIGGMATLRRRRA